MQTRTPRSRTAEPHVRRAMLAAIAREPRKKLAIAYGADVCLNTLDAYLAGKPVLGSTARRIEQSWNNSAAGPAAA